MEQYSEWEWGQERTIPPELRSTPQGNLPMQNPNQTQVGGTHYTSLDVQPWEVMEHLLSKKEFIGFLKGNIIKYSIRQGRKADSPEDGQKCLHYIKKLKEITGEEWA